MSITGGEDKYSEIRGRYEEQVLGEMRQVRTDVETIKREMLQLTLVITAADLPNLKQRNERMNEVLQRHDPKNLADQFEKFKREYDDRLDKVEKFQTRALAILAFLNVLLGVFAIFREYIFPRRAAMSPTQTGMVVWHIIQSILT